MTKKTDSPAPSPLVFTADDDQDDIFIIEKALREIVSGVRIMSFQNGKQLLAALERQNNLPELVVLDLNMPVLDGRETLTQIRANSKFKNLPVIIFSTSDQAEEKKQCYDAGANFYFTKPSSYAGYREIMSILKSEWLVQLTV